MKYGDFYTMIYKWKYLFSFSTGISAMKNELVVLDLERIENEKVKMKPIKRFS